jgi:hypothetical protein
LRLLIARWGIRLLRGRIARLRLRRIPRLLLLVLRRRRLRVFLLRLLLVLRLQVGIGVRLRGRRPLSESRG